MPIAVNIEKSPNFLPNIPFDIFPAIRIESRGKGNVIRRVRTRFAFAHVFIFQLLVFCHLLPYAVFWGSLDYDATILSAKKRPFDCADTSTCLMLSVARKRYGGAEFKATLNKSLAAVASSLWAVCGVANGRPGQGLRGG